QARLAEIAPPARRLPAEPRRREMTRVTIADVLQKPLMGHCVAVLLDEPGQRALPVWIGSAEALAIAIGMTGFPVDRPITSQFVAALLNATGAGVEEVRIDALKENTFYATVRLRA